MKLQIFTIYDSKTHAYSQPLFFQNQAVAIRAFQQAVNDPSSYLNKSSEDYSLFHLGEFDDDDASFKTLNAPHCIGLASTFKKEPQL